MLTCRETETAYHQERETAYHRSMHNYRGSHLHHLNTAVGHHTAGQWEHTHSHHQSNPSRCRDHSGPSLLVAETDLVRRLPLKAAVQSVSLCLSTDQNTYFCRLQNDNLINHMPFNYKKITSYLCNSVVKHPHCALCLNDYQHVLGSQYGRISRTRICIMVHILRD